VFYVIRWFSNLILNSGTYKDYWRSCLKEGNEQKPHLLKGKINNSLAAKWKEARPMRDANLRIPAARLWTGTKVCLCHLHSAFPQPMNCIFALPTSWRPCKRTFLILWVFKTIKEPSFNAIHLEVLVLVTFHQLSCLFVSNRSD